MGDVLFGTEKATVPPDSTEKWPKEQLPRGLCPLMGTLFQAAQLPEELKKSVDKIFKDLWPWAFLLRPNPTGAVNKNSPDSSRSV